MADVTVRLLGAAFLGSVLALLVVDCVSWMRTSPLRHGVRRSPSASRPTGRRVHRTSRVTVLPAVAGICLGSGAAASLAGSHVVGRMPLAFAFVCLAAGLFVTEEGIRTRVTSIELAPSGVIVRCARGPPRRLPWPGSRSLRPPRWPWSGWRLMSDGPRLTLMPTDLWGFELVLDELVLMAGLRFDGCAWSRGKAAGLRRS